MAKIFINDLATALSGKYGYGRRQVVDFLTSVVSVIKSGLDADRMVKIRGLGTFKIIDVEARESVNVNTGERLTIESHSKLSFLPDNAMKELVNRPFSQFETVVLNDGVDFSDMSALASIIEEELQAEAENQEEEMQQPEELPAVEPPTEEPTPEEPLQEEPLLELVVEEPLPSAEPEHEDDANADAQQENEPASTANEPDQPADEADQPDGLYRPNDEPYRPDDEEDSSEDEDVEEEPAPRTSSNWWKWVLVVLLSLGVGFGAGYLVGQGTLKSSQPTATKAPKASAAAPKAQPQPAEEPTPDAEEVAPATEGPATATDDVPEWEKYDRMSPITRDGAYYIMGLDRVVKAREGDNTKLIAGRVYGGTEMSCYIEVYNGIDASAVLKAGTEVKIPKLQTKKAVRKKLQEQQNQ